MKILLIVKILITTTISWSQTNFNNYITLRSQGKIPSDFSTPTIQKLDDQSGTKREDFSRAEEAEFLEMIHFGIDNVLHSGLCVYGDPISNYVSDVARNLLKDNTELHQKLRFYTIKSNVPNAFSTDQGIVFITTGLISQFSNEAQLAYVLSHEITHYTKQHVIQTFDWKLKNFNHHHIDQMSTYSKDKEFEADLTAVELCYKAGYSDYEVYNSFNVLMYSYLPFDEIAMPKTYFNTNYLYVPENYFPNQKYEIKAEEDYNDEFSSHPNIKRRKEKVSDAINSFNNWGNGIFIVDETRFFEVRNIARFESIRSDVLEGNFANSLYSIFLLEKNFPNSIYLSQMKAHSWLGLLNFKNDRATSAAVQHTSEFEGESASIHFFLRNITLMELKTMALRQVYDIKKKYPKDEEVSMLYDKLISDLVIAGNFHPTKFSNKTFHQAAQQYILDQDTLTLDTLIEEISVTKYDRIKDQKRSDLVENFDSTMFHLYGISDIISDSIFMVKFHNEDSTYNVIMSRDADFQQMNTIEQKKILEERKLEKSNNLIRQLIVVEPTVVSSTKKGVNNVKSENLGGDLSEAIDFVSIESGIAIYHIDKRTLSEGGTEAFNERNTLMTVLHQMLISSEMDLGVLPVDYMLLQEIKNHYGCQNVMFTIVENYRKPRINGNGWAMMFLFPPVLPLILQNALFGANQTKTSYLVINLQNGKILHTNTYSFNSPVKKWYLRTQMYKVFTEIHSKN